MAERDGKKWLLGALALLLAIAGLLWNGEETPVPAVARDVPMQADGETEKREGRWNILGTEEASREQPLKDPFSLLHGERGSAEKKTDSPASPSPEAAETARETPPVKRAEKDSGKKDAEWTLKGVLSGEKERLAIVSNGRETRTVAVGETFGHRVVTAIGEDSLSFSDETGEGELRLPGF